MMRSTLVSALAVPLLATTAAARPSGGGSGGALSAVSSGLGAASRGDSVSPSGSGGNDRVQSDGIVEYCYDRHGRALRVYSEDVDCLTRRRTANGYVYVPRKAAARGPARVDFYAGAQKVHDSDGSASIELAVTQNRFRLAGTYARYFERLGTGDTLTMQMPTLTAGVRIDDFGATTVILDGGVVHVRTAGDVMGDTKLTGPIAGMRVEHAVSNEISLNADVQQLWFDNDIRATGGRVGVRYRHVQASFRVLDFNVGPALYGPEVGVRF